MVLVGKLIIAASTQLRAKGQFGEDEDEEAAAAGGAVLVVTIDGIKACDTEWGGVEGNRNVNANSNI